MRIRIRFLAMALAGVAALASQAHAGTTASYFYSGTVDDCPFTGIPPCGVILDVGDTVQGPWTLDGAVAVPNASVDFTSVLSFSVMVGSSFAVDSNNSSLVDGVVSTDTTGNLSGGYLVILATALPNAPPTTVTLDLDTSTWVAEALVPGIPKPVFIASGTGSFAAVPAPGALLLFAPALGALGWMRRRPA